MTPNSKLYVILDKFLPAGLKMAQGIHAFKAFGHAFPELERSWFEASNNIVVLEHSNLHQLKAKLTAAGHELVEFCEPDLADRLTALCVAPTAKKHLASVKLAA